MTAQTPWLVRKFLPGFSRHLTASEADDPSIRIRVGTFEGWLATLVNVILFGVKFALALTIHSIALMADAFHSLADGLSSFIIIVAFKVSGKPADVEHPYGHGRAEYIGTLVLSLLIVVTGVEFIRSSFGRIEAPAIEESTPLMIGIVLSTAVIKEILARISLYLGVLIDSDSLKADAWHHRSDAFSSIAPIASMVLANFGKAHWDGILGVGVGLFIVWVGFSVGRGAIDSLLGKPPGPELMERIRSSAQSIEGIIDVHSIVVHSYGLRRFISLHMEVDQDESQLNSHRMASQLMEALSRALHANVNVHVDPVTTRGEKATRIKGVLDELVELYPEVDSYHDFRLVQGEDHKLILVKLAVEAHLSSEQRKQIRRKFSGFLQKRFPEFENRVRLISPVHDY